MSVGVTKRKLLSIKNSELYGESARAFKYSPVYSVRLEMKVGEVIYKMTLFAYKRCHHEIHNVTFT